MGEEVCSVIRRRRVRARFLALGIAIAIAGCQQSSGPADLEVGGSTTSPSGTSDPDDARTEAPVADTANDDQAPELPNEASAAVARQERRHLFPDPLADLQLAYGVAPVMLPKGTITTDQLGIRMTMHLDDWWRLEWAGRAQIDMAPPDNPIGTLRPFLSFERPSHIVDPALAPYNVSLPGEGTWPLDGLREWIDALDQVVLLDTETFELSGRSVTRYDVDLDPSRGPTHDGCSPGSCIWLLSTGAQTQIVLRDLEQVRYYEVADALGPILITSIAPIGDNSFLARVDALVRQLEFGPSAPHPIPQDERTSRVIAVPRGRWSIGAIGSVEIEVDTGSVALQRPGRAGIAQGRGMDRPHPAVVRPLTKSDSKPIVTIADITEAFVEDVDWEVEELGAWYFTDLDGREITGVEVTVTGPAGGDQTPPILLAPLLDGDDPRMPGWPTGVSSAHLILFESAVGPMVVSFEQTQGTPLNPADVERAREFASTIAFVSDR